MASRTNYYEFQRAKVAIALELMKRGWKVYGFHEDESDSMTDYWSPAWWEGIATKNGYVVVVDCCSNHNSGKEIRIRTGFSERAILSAKTQALINKLKEVRQDRGASADEEKTAKEKIDVLMKKAEASKKEAYEIIDTYPTYQENPSKMTWHVEKDGTIIAKGNGVAKFADMQYFDEKDVQKDLELYSDDKTSYRYERAAELLKLNESFKKLMNKIDTAAGAMIGGDGEAYVYETVTVTEYKKENKAVEKTSGKIQDGQCFIIKSKYFNCGICAGYVYRIHEREDSKGRKYYSAMRLNKKLNKELTGYANSANNVFNYLAGSMEIKFNKWIEKGAIAWCDIEEVTTSYEVQKCVKKSLKAESSQKTDKTNINKEYNIAKDIDTRDNSEIFVVKIITSLSKDEFAEVSKKMKSMGGYYSRFKKGFIFKYDPTEELNK